MRDREIDDPAEFVLVDAPCDRRDQRDVQSGRGEAIQGANPLLDDARLASQRQRRSALESIELEVERRLDLGELLDEPVVACDSLPIRIARSAMYTPTSTALAPPATRSIPLAPMTIKSRPENRSSCVRDARLGSAGDDPEEASVEDVANQ
jgi:hypothetical protein